MTWIPKFALTRGPSQLLPSDSAPVLQYGSGPSSDFLAKIFGVDTPRFLCSTQFYFPLSSLLLCKSSKRVLSLCIYFLSSFIHIREQEEHSWFLNVLWPKLNYYYMTPFQNVSLPIWPLSFHILMQRWLYVWFILPQWQSPQQSLCVQDWKIPFC
jgi:hypothetical protein